MSPPTIMRIPMLVQVVNIGVKNHHTLSLLHHEKRLKSSKWVKKEGVGNLCDRRKEYDPEVE
jgi:hypothetical protein